MLALALGGCELQEILLSTPEDLVVAEVYAQVGLPGARAYAYLHRSSPGGGSSAVPGAEVTLIPASGGRFRFLPAGLEDCVLGKVPTQLRGSCYVLEPAGLQALRARAELAVEIALPGGGELRGTTTVPGAFAIARPAVGSAGSCSVPPETRLEVSWSPSQGAWAYVSETEIAGLAPIFAPQGIRLEMDPLVLIGLSISRADTTIVFPSEFGVFERGGVDREILLTLQRGLPPGTGASVVVAASDRNYVNWVRGGGFNPSGQVRIPSLVGPGGTGVFGSQVLRRFAVSVEPDPADRPPACSGVLPPGPGGTATPPA